MADLIIGSVLDSLTGKLVNLVSREIDLAGGVRPELQKLRSSTCVIRAKLREAEKRQIEDEDLKEWLKQLEDVLYDADDLVDDFSTKVFHRPRATGTSKRLMQFFSGPEKFEYDRKMAHKIKEMRERINSILDDGDRLQVGGNNLGVMKLITRPETSPLAHESYLIGRDEDKKKVVQFLLDPDSENNVSILPIVGVGGLGKTTLARLAFNDKSVEEYFELKLWVCVSTDFNVDDILKKIVRDIVKKKELVKLDIKDRPKDTMKLSREQLLENELAKLDNTAELHKKLREELDGKKFLIVFDDVWNENRRKWLVLEEYLKKGAKGSKILVTTRSLLVASTMSERSHKLQGLPEDKSLSLLMLMAGKKESEWKDGNLEKIAKDIVNKCAGVPLAIMTIGRLLISRNTEEGWLKFKDNEISRIHQEEGDIMPTLRLSYDFLPSHLKRCFSYCSLFPKDYELDPDELIRLWMAQGFIKPLSNRQGIEEAGHDYFLELLSRSFFQDAEYDVCDNLVRCKMHDLMHDLAESVAGDDYVRIDDSYTNDIPVEARHVSVVPSEDYKWSGFERDNGRVRSLLLIATKPTQIGHLDVSCFANLRSLRLQNAGITKISRSLGKMEHLRSLDLSGNYHLRSLPNSINKLRNLETLNLNGCSTLTRLPSGITKLVNLRHLDVRKCIFLKHMPRGIGKLTNLRTLSAFVVVSKGNSARCKELCKLVKLRKELCITFMERISISSEFGDSFPIEKLALQSLELQWCNDREVLERLRPHPDLKRLVIHRYTGDGLSSWFSQLDKLVEIEIVGYRGRQVPQFDQLRFLKRIFLRDCRSLESIELSESATDQSNLFPSLEEIELTDLDYFWGWERKKRRDNGSEDEDGSSCMLPRFSDKVKVSISECQSFNYSNGQQLSKLLITTEKMLEQLSRPIPEAEPTPIPSLGTGRMAMIPISYALVSTVTSLKLRELKDVVLLPEPEWLFRHLSALTSLVISECDRLKALPVRTILRCLPNLEELRVIDCVQLYFEDEDGDRMHNQLQQGHQMLRQIIIESIPKMETLPAWFQYLPNLQHLGLRNCEGLKSLLPASQFLSLLNSLEVLWIDNCREVDLSAGDKPETLEGTSKLQSLRLLGIDKMESLPWWIQHLTSLQTLDIIYCSNLKAFPEWFSNLTSLSTLSVEWNNKELKRRCRRNKGEDWPKISHISNVIIK